jgi:hypothetical protein
MILLGKDTSKQATHRLTNKNKQASVQKLKMNSAIHTEKTNNQHKQAGSWNKYNNKYTSIVHGVTTTTHAQNISNS